MKFASFLIEARKSKAQSRGNEWKGPKRASYSRTIDGHKVVAYPNSASDKASVRVNGKRHVKKNHSPATNKKIANFATKAMEKHNARAAKQAVKDANRRRQFHHKPDPYNPGGTKLGHQTPGNKDTHAPYHGTFHDDPHTDAAMWMMLGGALMATS